MMQTLAISNVTCGIISAKWALDLGFSQIRQILFLVGGLLFGPVILLILYVFLINQAKAAGQPGGRVV
jgi:chromate transport protein ChrA